MTDLNDIAAYPRRANAPVWLAIATTLLLLPAGPAMAADSGEGPREPIYPRPLDRPATADKDAAGPAAPTSDKTASEAAAPVAAIVPGPAAAAGESYGPPAPKSEHGKVPEIDWESAPQNVPPALENAVHIVTRNYPSVKSSRAALRAAAADVRSAKWLRFPTLSANIAYRDADNSPVPEFSVEVPVWTGGRISSQIRRARADENVSSAQYMETVQNLALTTVQTYFQIAQLTLRQQAQADSLAEHRKLVATMERRVAQEVSPLADLELARSRTAQVSQEYNLTRSQRDTQLRLMAELVADPDYDLGPLPFFDPDVTLADPGSLEEQAVAYDPSRRRLMSQVDSARAQYDASKASIFPQVASQYTYDDFYKSRVGVVLKMQTNSGLSQFSQMESARLKVDSAMQQVLLVEQQLRRTVASDLIEYRASRERAGISAEASSTASKVSASYMRQFIAGRRSWLDVMNALREAVNAQIGKSDAEVTAMWAATRLLLRSGRWHPTFDNHDQ